MVALQVGRLRRQRAGEHSRADVAEIEGGGADFGEADRRQVHFASDPGGLHHVVYPVRDLGAGNAPQLGIKAQVAADGHVLAKGADGRLAHRRLPEW